jgi:hypothetical protein
MEGGHTIGVIEIGERSEVATADNMANLLVATNGDPDLRMEGMKLFFGRTLLSKIDEQADQTFILFKDMSCLLTSGEAVYTFDSPLEAAESEVRLSEAVSRACWLMSEDDQ